MLCKRSKKDGYVKYVKDFYLSIISHVKEYHKLPDLSISKQSRNYYIRKLKQEGVLIKKGYATWEIDEDRLHEHKQVKNRGNDTKNIRCHGFHIRLRLPRVSNWAKRKDYLLKSDIPFIESKAVWSGQRIMMKGCKIWLTDKSIIIYYPKGKSFYGSSAKEAKQYALYDLKQLIISLEHRLSITLMYQGRYQFRVCKQHYAKVKDAIAHQYNKEGKKINCYINSEHWLTIDKSLGEDELETLHPTTADLDQDKVIIPFLNDLKQHYNDTGESLKVSDLLMLINKQQLLLNTMMNVPSTEDIKNNKKLHDYIG